MSLPLNLKFPGRNIQVTLRTNIFPQHHQVADATKQRVKKSSSLQGKPRHKILRKKESGKIVVGWRNSGAI